MYLALGIATQQRSTVESVVHHRHLNLVEMSDLARKTKYESTAIKEPSLLAALASPLLEFSEYTIGKPSMDGVSLHT